MSLIFLVFMIVPIIAPSIGAGVAALAGWRAIFFVFAAMSLLMIAWLRRLPETLEPQDVRRLDWRTMIAGWLTVPRHRRAAGYMIESGLMQGGRFGYRNSSEQIIAERFDARSEGRREGEEGVRTGSILGWRGH